MWVILWRWERFECLVSSLQYLIKKRSAFIKIVWGGRRQREPSRCEDTVKTRLFVACFVRIMVIYFPHTRRHIHTHSYGNPHTSKCTYLHTPVFALMHARRRNIPAVQTRSKRTNKPTLMEDVVALSHTSTIKKTDWLAHSGGDSMNDASAKGQWFEEPTARQSAQRRSHIDELVTAHW